MTGLSAFVIRAWEKRYEAVVPSRTETNRRLYSEEDIEKLRLLNEAVKSGHNIGGIAKLSVDELRSILKEKFNAASDASGINLSDKDLSDTDTLLKSAIDAIKVYDDETLETLLLRTSAQMSQPQLIENFLVPLIYKIGDLWHEGEFRISNEHMATAVIRTFLANLIEHHTPPKDAPVLVSATPRGQEHELGALIAGLTAASSGWKVIYLGPNLPLEEIASVAVSLEVKAVALSLIYPNDDPRLRIDLVRFKKMLPAKLTILVGGRAAGDYRDILDVINAVFVKDTTQLKSELEAIRAFKFN
ncbi:MAG: cobalamin-dependent protein [Ignavibacteriaceae bacterium]